MQNAKQTNPEQAGKWGLQRTKNALGFKIFIDFKGKKMYGEKSIKSNFYLYLVFF